jgi:hypothetical protein
VIASGNGVFQAIFKDDVSASYSTDAVPVVDWFVPDKSPLDDGDFCTEELQVPPPPLPPPFAKFSSSLLKHRAVIGAFVTAAAQALSSAARNSSAYKMKMKAYNETIQNIGKVFG